MEERNNGVKVSSCNDKQVANEDGESSEEFKICSPLQRPDKGGGDRLRGGSEGGNPFTTPRPSWPLRTSLLSNSILNAATSSNLDGTAKPFVLNPARLSNPFTKAVDEKEDINKEEIKEEPKASSKEAAKCNSSVSFVPLGVEGGSTATGCSLPPVVNKGPSTIGSFVFGQNLRDKVETAESNPEPVTSSENVVNDANKVEAPKSNGTTTEMLFSSAVKSEVPENKVPVSQDGAGVVSAEGAKSLSEAAREYEESRAAVKRKYEAVQVITGEEQESNVLQMNCKLFAYDKSSWQERGRGTLRLNDIPGSSHQSRVIIRAAGSLRLLLNTKIWAGMKISRASGKSLTLTAMDSNGGGKVFLVMATQKEVDQLQSQLEQRVSEVAGPSKRARDSS